MAPDALTAEKIIAARAKYSHVLPHIELAGRDADGPLSEKQLWHLIARHVSQEWGRAYARLQNAWQARLWLQAPDNRPLGAIGQALAAEEIHETQQALDDAQSVFTLVDEDLRGDDELRLLLEDQLARQRSLEASLGISQGVLGLTLDLDFTEDKPKEPLGAVFGRLAKHLGHAMRRPPSATPKPSA